MDNDYKRLVELKKIKQNLAQAPDSDSESQKSEIILPQTFKEKWDNYWYHYKIVTWLVVFVVFILGWIVKDFVFKPKYDITLNVVSKYALSLVNDDMEEKALLYIDDYNGNGKRNLLINEMQVNYDGTAEKIGQQTMAGQQKVLAILSAGEDFVFILDKLTYDILIEANEGESIFVDFSEYFPYENEFVNGDKIILNNTKFGKDWKMTALKSEMYLCVRDFKATVKENEKNKIRQKNALDFAYNVIKK